MNNTLELQPCVQEELNFEIKDSQDLVIHKESLKEGMLFIQSGMPRFFQQSMPQMIAKTQNFGTKDKPRMRNISTMLITGHYVDPDNDKTIYCPLCKSKLDDNGVVPVTLTHLPNGGTYTKLTVNQRRIRCVRKGCGYNYTYHCEYKAEDHMVTRAMMTYTRDLLAYGLNLKTVSFITGLSRQVVKEIDKERLQELYTLNGTQLIRPKEYSKFLAIDEFKLHDGHKYATVIIDLETGHILWLAHGKKKSCVYEFIKFVGESWMKHVKAVACDMNSDFEEAFKEKCPHLKIIYDRFHIFKNFNDKVISEVRKDEQKRLKEEGKEAEAASLKHSKYVLMASRKTREQYDKDASEGKLVSKASPLFNKPELRAKGGMEEKYQELINENTLLFTVDLVKEQLNEAFNQISVTAMRKQIEAIIKVCRQADNKHFTWFANLLENHIDGIVWYARYHISTSKLEGINNMIKTERRKGYGYPDDEYFFLRIIDASHRKDKF